LGAQRKGVGGSKTIATEAASMRKNPGLSTVIVVDGHKKMKGSDFHAPKEGQEGKGKVYRNKQLPVRCLR